MFIYRIHLLAKDVQKLLTLTKYFSLSSDIPCALPNQKAHTLNVWVFFRAKEIQSKFNPGMLCFCSKSSSLVCHLAR